MGRLAFIILFSVFYVDGLVRHTVDLSEFHDNDLIETKARDQVKAKLTPLWVLDLNTEDLDDIKLKIGGEEEEREFEYAVGGNIREIERRQRFLNRGMKKDPKKQTPNVTVTESELKIVKQEIIQFLNKLVFMTIDLSDPEAEGAPSASIYFKGPYTSLAVKMGNKQWHYFMKTSPFPDWFHTTHPAGGAVDIPTTLRNTFYTALLRMLKMFVGFPV